MSFDVAPFGSLFSTPQKNGLTRPKSVRGSGVPMVNMNELFAFSRIHNIEMDLVPIVDKESHFLLETEDLLFARQSLVLAGAGKCSIFIGNTKPTVFESHIIRCRLNKIVSNPYFYYYFFQSVHGRTVMETIAEQGAGASGIRGSDLVKLLVPCPSKSYQDAIVKILTPLDNRISLLRETNITLEAIAQTLFKSWFVDFDPVKSKAEGRLPEGMDEASAALFPSEFEESALGLIPKGWGVGTLADVMKNESSTFNFSGVEKVIFINTGDVSDGQFLHSDFSAVDTLKGQAKKAIRENDVLFSEIRPKNKRFAYVNFDPKNYVVSTKFMVLRSIHGIHPRYIYQVLRQSEIIETFNVIADSRSGTFPQITFDSIKAVKIVIPSNECINKYIDCVTALFQKVDLNFGLEKELKDIRDTLLPRLISGQLRLNQAQ